MIVLFYQYYYMNDIDKSNKINSIKKTSKLKRVKLSRNNANSSSSSSSKKLFYGGTGKMNLGSMQPVIKSLLIKNRNLSYYLEYIKYKLGKENESQTIESDNKMKASDLESVLQSFSVAINIVEAKKDEIRNAPKEQPDELVVSKHYEDSDEEFYECESSEGFCVLSEDRKETTIKYFEEIKNMIESYISLRTQKISEKLADEENNKKYITVLKNLVKNLLNTFLQSSTKELVSLIPVASEITSLDKSLPTIDEPSVDAILLTEVESKVIDNFNTFNAILAQDVHVLTSNLNIKINELLIKVQRGEYQNTLLELSTMLTNYVGTYIEIFILNNVNDYKSFIETIFLKVNNNSNIFNAVLNCNSLIQNYATKIILNKDVIEKLIKSLGTSFDILNLVSIISFTNLSLSGYLIDSIITKTKGPGVSNLIEGTLAYDFTKIYDDDTNLKKDGFLLLADQLMKINDPMMSFVKSKINSITNNVTGILYRNDEMVKSLNEKRESGEQLLNVVLGWNKTINEIAFKGISYANRGQELWKKLEASFILRQFDPNTEKINVNINLTKIYEDYDNIIKEVNGVVCKLRCVETFLPISMTSLSFIPDDKFQNFDEEEIAFLLQYIIKTNELSDIKNVIKSLTELTSLVQNEISKESSMKEFIKIKIHEVAKIDEDCNEKSVNTSTSPPVVDNFWSWNSIKKSVQDAAVFAVEGTIEGRTPEQILELDEAKFKDLSLFSGQKGGTIIDKENRKVFYSNLSTIIYSDWRMTNLVLKKELNVSETELLHTCLEERLAAYRILKNMGLMDVKCFESVLRKLSMTVVKSIKDEYEKLQQQTINDDNFLVSILDLLCTQRIKLCIELFSKYYDTEGYKLYRQKEGLQFSEMWETYKTKIQETLLQNTLTYGWKATQFVVNVLSGIHEFKSVASDKFKKFFFTGGVKRKKTRKNSKRRTFKRNKNQQKNKKKSFYN